MVLPDLGELPSLPGPLGCPRGSGFKLLYCHWPEAGISTPPCNKLGGRGFLCYPSGEGAEEMGTAHLGILMGKILVLGARG